MYKVSFRQDEHYGSVVALELDENGSYSSPFVAVQQALSERRTWKAENKARIRFLIDGKIMTTQQMEQWQREEYQSLPKCQTCAQILDGEVHTHQLCGDSLFCGKVCADQAYFEKLEKLMDENEIDYL
jgi:hypothetical protein